MLATLISATPIYLDKYLSVFGQAWGDALGMAGAWT